MGKFSLVCTGEIGGKSSRFQGKGRYIQYIRIFLFLEVVTSCARRDIYPKAGPEGVFLNSANSKGIWRTSQYSYVDT